MNKRDLTFWAKVAAFFIVYTVLMSWIQEKDMEAELFERYANGVAEGIAIESKVNKERKEDKAVQWWVDTTDMEKVRDRLCKNYNRPKVK